MPTRNEGSCDGLEEDALMMTELPIAINSYVIVARAPQIVFPHCASVLHIMCTHVGCGQCLRAR